MKTIIIGILFMVLFTAALVAQTDSVMNLKQTDFSLFKLHKVKYQSTGETVMEKEFINLENVRSLKFLNNDSLILTKHAMAPVCTKLSHINEVSKYKRRLSPVLGVTIGALSGILLTGITVWLTGAGFDLSNSATIVLIVASVGGFIGSAISNSINHTILDLSSVPDKDKKAKLIKFLREK